MEIFLNCDLSQVDLRRQIRNLIREFLIMRLGLNLGVRHALPSLPVFQREKRNGMEYE